MLKQIHTWKIGCSQCGCTEIYNVEQPDNSSFVSNYNLPEGWARIEDPRPEADLGRRRGSGFTTTFSISSDYFYVPTYREYCPTCHPLVVKAAEEKKARDEHAEKYL